MKVNVKDSEIDAMHGQVASGATKGLAISTLLSAGMCAGLYQLSEGFRNLRLPLKFATFIMPIAAGVTIGAEEALLGFERAQYKRYDKLGEEQITSMKADAKKPKSWKTWAADHKYELVAGAWITGVGLSLAYSYSNPYVTATQKAFHARVYSQAITVAALGATALVTPFATSDDSHERDEKLFQQRLAFEEKKWQEVHPEAGRK